MHPTSNPTNQFKNHLNEAPAFARIVISLLERLKNGSLYVEFPNGKARQLGKGGTIHARLKMANWGICAASLKSGDIGFAESYIAGDWNTPDLTTLIRLLIQNRAEVESIIYGTWTGRLVYKIKHWLNRNSRSNSKKNIQSHYDLGNSFYQLWLDPTMNYSSALFQGDFTKSLEEAQSAKIRRALDQIEIKQGARILEIGCGWGALAEIVCNSTSTEYTGITLSQEQLSFSNDRLRDLGLQGQATFRMQDYRDLHDEPFDAICSIEMIEAVGQSYWPTYFETLAKMLKPGAKACVQSIVIHDSLFERYINSTDFIQQYIFPGGCLLSPAEFVRQAQNAGLEVIDSFSFGHDYAETLRRWREAVFVKEKEILEMGFDNKFIRIWTFYLSYCEAAFLEYNTDVLQYTLVKPLE
tara:strand:+ start:467 stop:1699 length:1233 start_codon:yes stop_codon:yes gene_type:complete